MTKHGGHPVAVINVDQHASRRRPDLVPDALAELAGVDGLVFQFERTAGDEVQGVCAAPQAVVDVVLPALDEAEALPWVLERMPRGFRPIVVDNGSTDDTAGVAARHGAVVAAA